LREARRALLDEEGADAPRVLSRAGPDDGDVREAAVRDPALRPREHEAAIRLARARAHGAGLAARVGRRETEAADGLSAPQRREPALLLRLGADAGDGGHDEVALHRDERAHAALDALELLHDEPVADGGHPGAAVALEAGAEQAEGGELGHELPREAAFAEA